VSAGLKPERKSWERILAYYLIATIGVLAVTSTINQFHLDTHFGNVSMVYLVLVIAAALLLGRGPAIWVSLTSFLAFNWFFVEPRYTFDVTEQTNWSALITFLIIATVTGQLMAMLKARAWEARQSQRETAALADASWAVASRLDTNSALREVLQQVSKVIELNSAAFISNENGAPKVVAVHPDGVKSEDVLRGLEASTSKRLPIQLNGRDLGFVLLRLPEGADLSEQQMQIANALTAYIAVVLERDQLMRKEAQAHALADADRLKTALLSMVSHDFRSPLTSIKASISTLMEEGGSPLDDETKHGLHQAIDQETDRLNRMVGNILDLSRLEANAWRPKLEPIPVTELVGMALDQFSRENNARIDVKLDPALTDVNVDCVQLVQVMKNLIENALKYSKETVEIRSSIKNDHALLEVLDHGRGLAASDVEHLFEPFFRSNELQESNVPGVGVGLAVCRGLVEAHHGTITAENRDEGGAIFRVSLPLHPQETKPNP